MLHLLFPLGYISFIVETKEISVSHTIYVPMNKTFFPENQTMKIWTKFLEKITILTNTKSKPLELDTS
jgi:hypothetical protein